MTIIFFLFIFLFGAVIGSFLNAVIWRLRTKHSFVRGRSMCTRCGHKLSAWDLMPILSYLLLGGKCRYCKKGISVHYAIVEVIVGVLFVLAALQLFGKEGQMLTMESFVELLRNWYFITILTIVFLYDLYYMQILRSVTLPATVLAFGANLMLGVSLSSLVLAVVIGGGFFWLQHRISQGQWIGGGDIHLGALMGAMLGIYGLLSSFLLAYVVGAALGIVLIAMKKADGKTRVPFGTFLSTATLVVLLYGEIIQGVLFHI